MGITFKPGPLVSLGADPANGLAITASLHRIEEAVTRYHEFEWLLDHTGQRVALLFCDLNMMLGVGDVAPYLEGGEKQLNDLTSLDVLYHVYETFLGDPDVEVVGAWWHQEIEVPLREGVKLRDFAERLTGVNPKFWPRRGVLRSYALYARSLEDCCDRIDNVVQTSDFQSFQVVASIMSGCDKLRHKITNYL